MFPKNNTSIKGKASLAPINNSPVKYRSETHYNSNGTVSVVIYRKIGSTFIKTASNVFDNDSKAKEYIYSTCKCF